MKLSFRIRRPYYDAIMAGTKKTELRRRSAYWVGRYRAVSRAWKAKKTVVAVFICGRLVHRRKVIALHMFSSIRKVEKALGRPLSDQGKKDLGPGAVVGFHLGEVVEEA